MIGRPFSFHPFFNQPVGDLRAAFRLRKGHKPQPHVHRGPMRRRIFEGIINQRKIVLAFHWLQFPPVEAFIFKPGIRVIRQAQRFTITLMKTGHPNPGVR
ncbi:hypothetical protein D3C73_1457270 [compost metagenome]